MVGGYGGWQYDVYVGGRIRMMLKLRQKDIGRNEDTKEEVEQGWNGTRY